MDPLERDPERLVRLARGGDTAALGRLLELYRNYLTLLARVQIGRRLRGKVGSSDLVQDVFVEAARDFGRFRGSAERELVAWLRAILAARLVDLVRRHTARKRDVRLERQLADELAESSQVGGLQLADPGTSPSQETVRREQAVRWPTP